VSVRSLIFFAAWTLLVAGDVQAGTLAFGPGRTIDWIRVFDHAVRPQKDSCLFANSLIKFDIGELPSSATVSSARLFLFVESTSPGVELRFSYVSDDSWRYPPAPFQDLFPWPVAVVVDSVACSDTMQVVLDVTNVVVNEVAAGDSIVSFKIESAAGMHPDVRIASPLAPRARMAPRLEIDFSGGGQINEADLVVHATDVLMSPMRPTPGQSVTLTASIQNRGPKDATNVNVAFYDGPPADGQLIGSQLIAVVAGGGASANASIQWTCRTGFHDIHVVVDEMDSVSELDEQNNSDFRTFAVQDLDQYWMHTESFEHGRFNRYWVDFEVPFASERPSPIPFYAVCSRVEAYHGHFAQEIFLDGTQDDGTVWLEGTFPVDPGSEVRVDVEFELFRYQPDIAFFPVVAIGVLDPEREFDFSVVPGAAVAGWDYVTSSATIQSGPYDTIHLGLGITVTWETTGTFFTDLVTVTIRDTATDVQHDTDRAETSTLHRHFPNPGNPTTTIVYTVTQPGPVHLQVYDVRGHLLRVLKDVHERPGSYRVHWDGTDRFGNPLPSGVYVYRLQVDGYTTSRKMLLLR
jgi:uncharacterized repeat protein (TIGR01451 family)